MGEINRLRPHYRSVFAIDAGRRQMLDHFSQFANDRLDQHREGVFRWYWKAICKAYPKAYHAFELGSSRETLAQWVRRESNYWVTQAELRMHLEEAVRRGWMRMEKAPNTCTKFFMVKGRRR